MVFCTPSKPLSGGNRCFASVHAGDIVSVAMMIQNHLRLAEHKSLKSYPEKLWISLWRDIGVDGKN